MKKSIFKLASEQVHGMTKEKVNQILSLAQSLSEKIDKVPVEGWMLDHITTAHDDILEVSSYVNQMLDEKR